MAAVNAILHWSGGVKKSKRRALLAGRRHAQLNLPRVLVIVVAIGVLGLVGLLRPPLGPGLAQAPKDADQGQDLGAGGCRRRAAPA